MTTYHVSFRMRCTGREYEEQFDSALARELFVIGWAAHIEVVDQWLTSEDEETEQYEDDSRTADELTSARAHPHCPNCQRVLEDCHCADSEIRNELTIEGGVDHAAIRTEHHDNRTQNPQCGARYSWPTPA